jgi:trehalose-6-phosphatase
LGRYVAEPDILREYAEKRNSLSYKYRHAGDDEAVNKACAQKSLNRNPAIDVGGEPR